MPKCSSCYRSDGALRSVPLVYNLGTGCWKWMKDPSRRIKLVSIYIERPYY